MKHLVLAIVAALSACTGTAPALAAPVFPDRGRAAVVDAAAVIPAEQERMLNDRIVQWNRTSGHQLVVATVPSLQGVDIKDYGFRLGRAWGLGDSKRNDGAILLLAPTERKVRIEVGYGLEPVLTDAATSGIIRDTIVPGLRAGDIPHALAAGADAVMAIAATEEVRAAPATGHPSNRSWSWWWLTLPTGLILAIGILRVVRRRRADWQEAEAAAAAARDAAAREERRRRNERTRREPDLIVPAGRVEYARPVMDVPRAAPRRQATPPAPPPPPAPAYVPPVYEAPRRREDDSNASYSSWGSSSSSSSSDSSSSSSGFDSGGGSFGGGGSDSSY